MTRKEMEKVIKDGGSVLIGGKIITNLDDLPTEADLAQGDPAKEAAAKAALEDQVKTLQAELAKLQKTADTKPEDKGEDKGKGKTEGTPPAT